MHQLVLTLDDPYKRHTVEITGVVAQQAAKQRSVNVKARVDSPGLSWPDPSLSSSLRKRSIVP